MGTITITFTTQQQQTKDVDLPAYLCLSGSYYKIISADTFIQVIPETANGEVTVKKWKNATTVTRLLSDPQYGECTADDFNQAYQSSLNVIAE